MGGLNKEITRKYYGFVAFFLVVILGFSFFRNLTKSFQVQRKIQEEERKVETLKRENERLKRESEKVMSGVYIEKQLRDRLGLAKEGEYIVVLPDEETLKRLAPKIEEEEEILPEPNWKKWYKLFFY